MDIVGMSRRDGHASPRLYPQRSHTRALLFASERRAQCVPAQARQELAEAAAHRRERKRRGFAWGNTPGLQGVVGAEVGGQEGGPADSGILVWREAAEQVASSFGDKWHCNRTQSVLSAQACNLSREAAELGEAFDRIGR